MTETEIKFLVEDFTPYRDCLEEMNADRTADYFEDNIIFDDEERTLLKEEKLLRLRKCDKITLTFKAPVEKSRFKVMEEFEVEVSNFEITEQIILSLGYRKVFRYQKNREIYSLQYGLVLLDKTPIGKFIEIEGSRDNIEKIVKFLSLNLNDGTSKNYMELYEEHCKKNNLEPSDMLF
jgi:adenylate cyclase class 2